MPESEALADMLMENRDFLFTRFAIWTSKAMSKEIAVTESLETVSLAPSTPAPKGFGCFLARCTEIMVGEEKAVTQNCRQVRGQQGTWPGQGGVLGKG